MPRRVVRCSRCGRLPTSNADVDEWIVVFTHGVVTGFECTDCQTPEASAEAFMREAVGDSSRHAQWVEPGDQDYGLAFGRHVVAVADAVWREWLTTVAALPDGEVVTPDPFALADETLARLHRTVGDPFGRDPVHDSLVDMFREWLDAARNQ